MLFGLSMDYHVFVLSRIREAVGRGLSTRDAVRVGITGSAGTVTSAAVVMVSVFAIFASLHLVEMKELGVGLGRGGADRRGRGAGDRAAVRADAARPGGLGARAAPAGADRPAAAATACCGRRPDGEARSGYCSASDIGP